FVTHPLVVVAPHRRGVGCRGCAANLPGELLGGGRGYHPALHAGERGWPPIGGPFLGRGGNRLARFEYQGARLRRRFAPYLLGQIEQQHRYRRRGPRQPILPRTSHGVKFPLKARPPRLRDLQAHSPRGTVAQPCTALCFEPLSRRNMPSRWRKLEPRRPPRWGIDMHQTVPFENSVT